MDVDKDSNGFSSEDEDLILKIRGLPWSTTVEEIIDFFSGCNIRHGKEGVFIGMTKEGRPSGEAFIELETPEDVTKGLKKDRNYVGNRYIEVFRCKRSEMEWVVRKSGQCMDSTLDDGCVRLRGLPFDCSKEEIAHFFAGLEIVANGITLPVDARGRSTGEAFVQFRSKEIAEKALLKHKEKIGHRYIEIFRSSLSEIGSESGSSGGRRSLMFPPRAAPYDARDRFGGMNRFRGGSGMMGGPGPNGMGSRNFRGGFADDCDDDDWGWGAMRGRGPMGGGPMGGGPRGFSDFGPSGGGMGGFGGPPCNMGPPGPHIVYMRGLPFRATKQDIADFFRPAIPLSIDLNAGDKGRAEVEFRTYEDALLAMTKDKSNMSHRYIELMMDKPIGGGGGGGRGGRMIGGSSIPGSRFKRF